MALDGYNFGRPQRSPLKHYTCNSNEPEVSACHDETSQCDPIDSAGVICEGIFSDRDFDLLKCNSYAVDCEDEQTQMLLEDNGFGSICNEIGLEQESPLQHPVPILAGTITPLVLTVILLMVIVIFLFLKLRKTR